MNNDKPCSSITGKTIMILYVFSEILFFFCEYILQHKNGIIIISNKVITLNPINNPMCPPRAPEIQTKKIICTIG